MQIIIIESKAAAPYTISSLLHQHKKKEREQQNGSAGWQSGILQSLQKGSMVIAEGKATAEGIMAEEGKGMS